MRTKTGQASTCVPKTGQYTRTKVRLASTCAPRQDWLISVHNAFLFFYCWTKDCAKVTSVLLSQGLVSVTAFGWKAVFLTFVVTVAGCHLVLVSAFEVAHSVPVLYMLLMHAGLFWYFHNQPNVGRIFNVHLWSFCMYCTCAIHSGLVHDGITFTWSEWQCPWPCSFVCFFVVVVFPFLLSVILLASIF